MAGTESLIFFKENCSNWRLEPLYLHKCIVVPFPFLLELPYIVIVLHVVSTIHSFFCESLSVVK